MLAYNEGLPVLFGFERIYAKLNNDKFNILRHDTILWEIYF